MKKSASSRRAPRRVANDSDSEVDSSASVVKRPTLAKAGKPKSTARLSFGGANEEPVQSPPRKANLNRIALEKSAGALPIRTGEDRPSYGAEELKALKGSTPSTPKAEAESGDIDLDMERKFGLLVRKDEGSAIPSAAEIREKKERRARMAKEAEYISLYGEEDGEDGRVMLREKEKYPETRLVREDENLAEGFEEFTEDGGVGIGRKAVAAKEAKEREEMRALIEADTDSSDEEERKRVDAYDRAQLGKGVYGKGQPKEKAIPKISPIADMPSVLAGLRQTLEEMKIDVTKKTKKVQELEVERKDIAEREAWVQLKLNEMGQSYGEVAVTETNNNAAET